jgi:Concanavalin A-like lectin/glucanases superfamily
MTGRGLLLLPLCLVALFVTAPAALADPTLTATPVVTGSSTLSLDSGTWSTTSGNGITYDYQWQSCSYPNAVLGDAPLAYYRLGDDFGVDVSGLDQPQLDATYTTHSGGIAGDSDTAYYNGPTSWAPGVTYPTTTGEELAPSDFPSGNAPITIEAWIKPDAFPHDDAFIAGVGDDATPGTSLNLELYNAGIVGTRLAAWTGSHRYVANVSGITARTFTHVAVTYDGTTLRLWENGTVVGTFTANLSLDPVEARIDASVPATTTEQAFGGSIDEVAFYGSALNATTLAAHISAGNVQRSTARCNDIPGANDTTFTVTPDLGGASIRGQVQASDDTGASVAWSNEVSVPGSVVVPQHADLTHSPDFGPVLVSGTVVDASGGPVKGARVSVYQNLSTRTRVTLPVVGEAITDADGNYSISYGDGSIATLNLLVTARGTGVAARTYVDRVYDASGAWLDGDGLLPQPLQLALPATAAPQPLAGASRALPFYQCPPPSKRLIAGPYPGIMNVADVHTWSYTKAQLTYMKGSQTRVNIAASFTSDGGFVSTSSQAGANGGYSITQAYPVRPPNTSIVETTGYSAAEYAFGSCLSWTYTVEPYKFIGGTTAPRSAPLGASGKCKTTLTNNSVPEVPGAKVTRTNATGVTYSNGFTVSFGGFSVGLTIRTDWSNTLTEVWWPQSGGGRKLWFCGDGSKPYWYQAQRIYQGPWTA